MVREIGTTTTRGAVGPHLPALREKTLFGPRSAPSRHRKHYLDQQLGYDLAEPADSGIKRRRQGNSTLGLGTRPISPVGCILLVKYS
jgi:hypothetical protein